MSKFQLQSNRVVIVADDGTSVDLQTALDTHCKNIGLPFSMVVTTDTSGNRRLVMPDSVYERGGSDDEKAYHAYAAMVACYKAMKDSGVSSIVFRTMRRDRATNKLVPANAIFLNEIEGIPGSFRNGQPQGQTQQVQDTGAKLAAISTEYYTLGGEDTPPTLPEAALIGWFNARVSSLKTAAVAAEITKVDEQSEADVSEM
jgi:hypothetical protein